MTSPQPRLLLLCEVYYTQRLWIVYNSKVLAVNSVHKCIPLLIFQVNALYPLIQLQVATLQGIVE